MNSGETELMRLFKISLVMIHMFSHVATHRENSGSEYNEKISPSAKTDKKLRIFSKKFKQTP